MQSHLKNILVALFTCGWVLPAWLGASQYIYWWHVEAGPRLRGLDPVNSFPFLHFVLQMMAIAACWLFLALFYWAWRVQTSGILISKSLDRGAPNPA